MALPKIDAPVYEIQLPLSKKQIRFRPFLVKEEKILLMAQQSGDEKDITNAIMQIINNCVTSDEEFNVSKLATFDLEYIFLKIRAKSVNNIVELSYRDTEDNKLYDFKVNLDNIEITYNKKNNNKFVEVLLTLCEKLADLEELELIDCVLDDDLIRRLVRHDSAEIQTEAQPVVRDCVVLYPVVAGGSDQDAVVDIRVDRIVPYCTPARVADFDRR